MCAYGGLGLLALRQGDLDRALPRARTGRGPLSAADPGYFPMIVAALGVHPAPGASPTPCRCWRRRWNRRRHRTGARSVAPCGWLSGSVVWRRPEEAARPRRGRWRSPGSTRNAATRRYALAAPRRDCGAARAPGWRSGRNLLPPGPGPGRGARHAPAPGPLSPWPWHIVREDRPPEQAHAELSTAITLYRAMDMTFWLPRAEGALAQVVGAGGQ